MQFSLVSDRVHVTELDSVDSTNAELHRMIESGTATDFTVVIAGEQTAGRGRQGRAWQSKPGAGIWTSILVDLEDCPCPTWLSLIAGLAITRGVRVAGISETEFSGAGLKWPNDVIAQDRKLAGILTEGVTGTSLYIVGMGINVSAESFPGAIGVAELLTDVETTMVTRAVFEAVVTEFVALIDGWRDADWDTEAIRAEYLSACRSIGADLGITEPDGTAWSGVGVGLDDSGHLLVQESGTTLTRTVVAADVVHATIDPCTQKNS